MNKQTLYKILQMEDVEVLEFMRKHLIKHGYTVYEGEDDMYIVALPSIQHKTALIAHIDTVHFIPPKKIIEKQSIITSKTGLGADDRAGIYAIWEIVRCSKYKPVVILTNMEESGGIGAKQLVADIKSIRDVVDITLLIELDRRGCNDYVAYNYLPQEIAEYIEMFGYEHARGSYSDIKDLTKAWHIPSVNLSIGYFNEHTQDEYLYLPAMRDTITRVKEMLKAPVEDFYYIEDKIPIYECDYVLYDDDEECYDDEYLLHELIIDDVIDDISHRCKVCGTYYRFCMCGYIEKSINSIREREVLL